MTNNSVDIKRRKLLSSAGLSVAVMYVNGGFAKTVLSAALSGYSGRADFLPDVEIVITARATTIDLLPGPVTRVLKFSAELIRGPTETVKNHPDTFSGPELRLKKGQKVRIVYRNELSGGCIVHWHGLHVPEKADGHPRYEVHGGETYIYEFEIKNRAGTYWYHSHTHRLTGERVNQGLAGVLIVTDREEQSLDLPTGKYDIPLVIQDRRFDKNNQLNYVQHMHERMSGFLGDRILINGRTDFELPVAAGVYRLRLLNLSNSRIYKLAWGDGAFLTVIGTDGGLLEKPERRAYIMLAPSERMDLWVDFRDYRPGTTLEMRSLPFSVTLPMMGGRGGMMGRGRMGSRRGGMMGAGRGGMHSSGGATDSLLPNGGEYSLFRVRVRTKRVESRRLPDKLSAIQRYRKKDAVNPDNPKTIRLAMRPHSPTLNGRSFEMKAATPFETIKLNSLVQLEFINRHPMMHGMIMAHPMHIHGQQFQVVNREVAPGYESDYLTVSSGFVDSGWKDTVLVMPGEKVTILKRFDDYTGLFLYHCHNLEHEDLDMMRNFLVQQ